MTLVAMDDDGLRLHCSRFIRLAVDRGASDVKRFRGAQPKRVAVLRVISLCHAHSHESFCQGAARQRALHIVLTRMPDGRRGPLEKCPARLPLPASAINRIPPLSVWLFDRAPASVSKTDGVGQH